MTNDLHLSRRARAQLLAAALDGQGDPALVKAAQARRLACDALVKFGRKRRFAMSNQSKVDRALEAYVRRNHTDWDPTASQKERDKANAETRRLIAAAGKDAAAMARAGVTDDVTTMVAATAQSRAVWDKIRADVERDMVKIAKALPVAPFVESVHGFGLPGLAYIIAETGSFDGYANPAKLWSRLGYAPYEGYAMSTWRRDTWRSRALSADEWVEHPFSAQRYAFMYVLAKPLRDHQWIGASKTEDGKGRPNGPYGQVYADRRAHTEITHPDWTDAHRDRDALRIMFKRFLADLWAAWIDTAFALDQRDADAQATRAESDTPAAGQTTGETQHDAAGGGDLFTDAA